MILAGAGSRRTSPDSFVGQQPPAPPGLDDGAPNMAGRGAHRML